VPTIGQWIDVLETTGEILVVPPYLENFGKRLVKSPKVYFTDSGVACHLLGIESENALRKSPFHGPILEGFVASEIAKLQLGRGQRREIDYFRDQQGLEVDFVVPRGGRLTLIEAKTGQTLRPAMGEPLSRLADAIDQDRTDSYVVYRRPVGVEVVAQVRPGVSAIDVAELPELFGVR
jgi:hypothetical protein